jgi:hypothetical protein
MMRIALISVIALIVVLAAGLMYAVPSGWRRRTAFLIVNTVGILTVVAAWLLLD